MNLQIYAKVEAQRRSQIWIRRSFLAVILLFIMMALGSRTTLAQGPYNFTLQVSSIGHALYSTAGTIDGFDYLINVDNSGDPNDPTNLPSTTPMASHSPVVETGTVASGDEVMLSLPEGRYLVTVRAADHKLGGIHIKLPDDLPADPSQPIEVELVNGPLPLSTLRVHVFHDTHPVNGENDIPVEQGLAGFHVVVEDTAGEVTVDWFGDPICGNGFCQTDANGDLVVENLPRGKYEVVVIPPNNSGWIQTTTIEGTHVIDAWLEEGDDGYSPREGFQTAAVWVGFVNECTFGDGADTCPTNNTPGSGSIQGTIKTIEEWTPPLGTGTAPALVLTDPVDRPWIALTDIGGTDEQVYLGRGNPDGSFLIENVPEGTYQVAIWDEPLDYIMAFYTVTIPEDPAFDIDNNPLTVDMNEMNPNGDGVGIPRWFGWFSGHVFLENHPDALVDPGDGVFDPAAEIGLPGVELLMRFRDGSIRYSTVTENDGSYEFPEVFELEKFYVTEVGFGHLGLTGATVHDEFLPYDPNDPATYEHFDDVLTVSNLNWAAKRTIVDWGKYNYDLTVPTDNGGISGIVQYATTRNEFEARIQATEDYEPGIPNVEVNLYHYSGDPANPKGAFIEQVFTDSWEHPSGCDATDSTGAAIPDPLNMGPNCIEVPNISNEVKGEGGVFDGGYAFGGLEAGAYVVEIMPPEGYKIVTEEDLNTAEGNTLTPAIPPAGCIGTEQLMQVPDEYGSPFDAYLDDGTPIPGVDPMPLCDLRLVVLQEGQNKGTDFYLMTDNAVPIPGRIFGFLLDDLNIETNPNFIYFGEKRGVPHTPVGIRDFTGRLITMLETDENGIFEVLLPSTYVADCPIPSGVCPAIYRVVGNDPGDPGNPTPNFNPNYQTITFVFDVWPGKTTYADVAVFPITAFTAFPGSQFGQPAVCTLPDTTPQLYYVSTPYGPAGTEITITGSGFGDGPGAVVTLDGTTALTTTWVNSTTLTVDTTGAPNGPGQLLIEANGETSRTGLTFHVIGGDYTPTIVTVDDNGPADHNSIQPAISGNPNENRLVVVKPGTYYDPITLNFSVKVQGYGPGAPDGLGSGGTVIDQRFILNEVGIEAINVQPNDDFNPQIDGFLIVNARDEQDVGGGLFINDNTDSVEVSNNVIRSNGGNFGGGIIMGQPYMGNSNVNVRIHHNRILHNGGISLAGAIGIFNGTQDYEIDHNDICGNYSGEYGGGISHFGLSHGGSIHHNRIYFNNAFDEGGGVLVGGELPLTPGGFTSGSGAVDIYKNLIQGNLSNDDGGGLRLLQPLNFFIDITNNMIVNNASTDQGGGVALDDASNVTMVNNTIARNANTSTAEDSDGLPHSAGVVAETYSDLFNDYLNVTNGYVDPIMFNNIICENQAYTWDGVSLNFDSFIDLEVFAGGVGQEMHPTYSLLTDLTPSPDANNNRACPADLDTLFGTPYETQLNAVSFRMEPNFVAVNFVTIDQPLELLGDYHLDSGTAVAVDAGIDADPLWTAPTLAYPDPVQAPCNDYDDQARPYDQGDPDGDGYVHDIGADEVIDGGVFVPGCIGSGHGLNVSLSANQAIQATVAGAPLDVALLQTLQNTGGPSDTYDLTISVDLGWTATVDPTTQALNSGESVPVTGTVTIPGNVISGTVATVHITATSQTNTSLTSTVIDTLTVFTSTVVPVPEAAIYLTFEQNNSPLVGSLINVHDEDIIGFDGVGDYVMVFDGSNVGLLGQELDAFDILDDGTILMSLQSATSVDMNGVMTPIADSDIVRFHPTSYGLNTTAGTFSWYLDGSAVGLTTTGEDIDAITLLQGNLLLISTRGNVRVPIDTTAGGPPWVNGNDEDLLLYEMQDEANPSAGGTWSLYFDGTDIGLTDGGNDEDINGASIQGEDNLYLTTRSYFWVDNGTVVFNGADEDIFTCVQPGVTPEGGGTNGNNTTTTCGGGFSSLFIGGNFGLSIDDLVGSGRDINGIDIP